MGWLSLSSSDSRRLPGSVFKLPPERHAPHMDGFQLTAYAWVTLWENQESA